MLAYVMKEPGSIDNLFLTEVTDPVPKEGHILIDVRAFGLNRSELYTIQGYSGDAVTYPRILGIECFGIVIDGGGTDLQKGQTVAAAMGFMGRKYDGSYAQKTLVPRTYVYPIKTVLPWCVLGNLPESYLTAWGILIEANNTQPGDIVLVRGASSSVGMAVTNIAKEMGCTVIGTTRKEEKVSYIKESGADYVVIDNGDIHESIRNQFETGVNSVVELVGKKSTILDSLKCCAPKGIVGIVGVLGNEWNHEFFPWMPSTVKLTMYSSETLTTEYATPILQNIVKHVEDGHYKANAYRQFKFKDLKEALKIMEASSGAGKLVILI